MIKRIRYVNSKGDEIEFGGSASTWRFGETSLPNMSLGYSEVGGTITGFDGGIREMDLKVFMRHGSAAERDRFVDVISYDTRVGVPGTLYMGGSYVKCWVIGFDLSKWQYFDYWMTADLTIVTDQPHWVREVEYTLHSTDDGDLGGLDYPHDYPHDYKSDASANAIIENPFQLPCRCDIFFPGPCRDPYVIIAGNRYAVDESVLEGQLLVIQGFGKKRDVYIRHSDGTIRSAFAKRVRDERARPFEPIPVGRHLANWPKGYNLTIRLYEERDAPLWQQM